MMRLDLDATAQSACNYVTQSKLLAEAIPATSFAVGRNAVTKFGTSGNIDMQASFKSGWPLERNPDPSWRHGDMRAVAYLYVYKLFDEIVEEGGLGE